MKTQQAGREAEVVVQRLEGALLEVIRIMNKMTVQTLCRRASVKTQTIVAYEEGREAVDRSVLLRLLRPFGMRPKSYDWMLEEIFSMVQTNPNGLTFAPDKDFPTLCYGLAAAAFARSPYHKRNIGPKGEFVPPGPR